MKTVPTDLPGVLLIEPDIFKDERGFFLESYHQLKYSMHGLPASFVQDNHSRSVQGTLRGLHAQVEKPQGKLVRVLRGKIWDVAVDIRRGSPTFRQWISVELSDENFLQCYIPPGFAHGFYTISKVAEVEYKCTDFYHPEGEIHLLWNDPAFGIAWPVADPILSPKDRDGLLLKDAEARLPLFSKNKLNSVK
jgi:dTDP-4-dehydrorhamnose 3,5-epimerase